MNDEMIEYPFTWGTLIKIRIMKEINEIIVPKEIEFISEWKEFEYPQGHLILDKTICGCGFTEYCIENPLPLILCSPRKTLLENKKSQHPEENIYYFKNEKDIEVYDKSSDSDQDEKPLSTTILTVKKQEELDKIKRAERINYINSLKTELTSWLNDMYLSNQVPKILVTYDSFHYILEVLGEEINNFAVVVDEFQSIFLDATFKATVELDFIDDLKLCQNVLYLSATPMLEKYLDQIDYFKDLPFYKLIWDKSRVENVRIERKTTRSINTELKTWINNYRGGVFPNKVLPNGEIKYSKELVIFVNSVKSICDIIKKSKLTPEETNIICAKTSNNIAKLKKVGHEIGKAPLRGDSHKMFTLCTRTTYLGSDFYSPCAYTIICSDCSISTLTVDISLDLPQIVGRQRLKENVFRNEVLFLYKAGSSKDAIINLPREEFEEYIKEKEKRTKKLLIGYSKMSEDEKLEWSEKASRDVKLYQVDFLGVSKRTGEATFNHLVKIAAERAYDVSRKEYQDVVTIKCGMESIGMEVVDDEIVNNELITKFCKAVESINAFDLKMEMICDFITNYPDYYNTYQKFILAYIPRDYQNYINQIGVDRIKALRYEESSIKRYIESNQKLSDSEKDIIDLFKVGEKYTKAELKNTLKDYYTLNNISKTPKANDIEEYFEVKRAIISDNGKRNEGFLLIKRKE